MHVAVLAEASGQLRVGRAVFRARREAMRARCDADALGDARVQCLEDRTPGVDRRLVRRRGRGELAESLRCAGGEREGDGLPMRHGCGCDAAGDIRVTSIQVLAASTRRRKVTGL